MQSKFESIILLTLGNTLKAAAANKPKIGIISNWVALIELKIKTKDYFTL